MMGAGKLYENKKNDDEKKIVKEFSREIKDERNLEFNTSSF